MAGDRLILPERAGPQAGACGMRGPGDPTPAAPGGWEGPMGPPAGQSGGSRAGEEDGGSNSL